MVMNWKLPTRAYSREGDYMCSSFKCLKQHGEACKARRKPRWETTGITSAITVSVFVGNYSYAIETDVHSLGGVWFTRWRNKGEAAAAKAWLFLLVVVRQPGAGGGGRKHMQVDMERG